MDHRQLRESPCNAGQAHCPVLLTSYSSTDCILIQHLWSSHDIIDIQDTEPDLTVFASASDKAAWEHKAAEYFGRKYYGLARQAYHNAGLSHEAHIAEAYLLREEAEGHALISVRRKAYETAACAFCDVAIAASADARSTYYRIAGECLLLVPNEARAAEAFQMGSEFTQAIQLYRRLGNFEQVANILQTHQAEVEPETEGQMRYASRLYYLITKKFKYVSDPLRSDVL